MKTGCNMFDFKLETKDDGTWLYVKASDGTSALINMENLAEKMGGTMVKKTILQWCADRRKART